MPLKGHENRYRDDAGLLESHRTMLQFLQLQGGEFRGNLKMLEKKTGYTTGTVFRRMADLERMSLVEIAHRRPGSPRGNTYKLLPRFNLLAGIPHEDDCPQPPRRTRLTARL